MIESTIPPLLGEALPDLARELAARISEFLDAAEDAELPAVIDAELILRELPALRIIGRCRCDCDFCGSVFVSSSGAIGLRPPDGRRLAHEFGSSDLIVRTEADGRAYEIEVLFRPEYRAQRDALNLPVVVRL